MTASQYDLHYVVFNSAGQWQVIEVQPPKGTFIVSGTYPTLEAALLAFIQIVGRPAQFAVVSSS